MEIVGGTDTKNMVKRILERMFSNILANKSSWTGSGKDKSTGEAKYKLQNIQLIKFLLGNINS